LNIKSISKVFRSNGLCIKCNQPTTEYLEFICADCFGISNDPVSIIMDRCYEYGILKHEPHKTPQPFILIGKAQ
jgi:hypothetical protein